MTVRRGPSGREIRLLLVTTTLLGIVACSNPLADDQATPGSFGTTDATATPSVAAMPIVTPTPFVASQPTETGSAPPGEVPATYIVAEGDTLYSIAVRYGLDIATLVELNQLSDPNDIFVGQELILRTQE
jgi:LysM repeat protein